MCFNDFLQYVFKNGGFVVHTHSTFELIIADKCMYVCILLSYIFLWKMVYFLPPSRSPNKNYESKLCNLFHSTLLLTHRNEWRAYLIFPKRRPSVVQRLCSPTVSRTTFIRSYMGIFLWLFTYFITLSTWNSNDRSFYLSFGRTCYVHVLTVFYPQHSHWE